jgi:hypothetical protein
MVPNRNGRTRQPTRRTGIPNHRIVCMFPTTGGPTEDPAETLIESNDSHVAQDVYEKQAWRRPPRCLFR